MLKHRLTFTFLILALLLFGVSVAAQDSYRRSGIDALKSGDLSVAVKLLERAVNVDKTDDLAWNFLGIAYLKLSRFKDSTKALQKAIKLQPRNAEYRAQLAYNYLLARNRKAESTADKALGLDKKNATAHFVKSVIEYRSLKYQNAYDHADQAIASNAGFTGAYRMRSSAAFALMMKYRDEDPHSPKIIELMESARRDLEFYLSKGLDEPFRGEVQAELDAVRYFIDFFTTHDGSDGYGQNAAADSDDTSTPLTLTFKPKPSYTDRARQRGAKGTVHLLVAFLASGKIGPVILTKSLDDDLDRQAIIAAQGIKFTPATRNGVPITLIKRVEYSFDIY